MNKKAIKCIYTEHPEQWIWTEFNFLQNEETARRYLLDIYSERQFHHPDHLAYRNVPAFTAYINQASTLIRDSEAHRPYIRPLLLYYGMMSLLKAWLLTRIPDYPQNTAVLQHGLSTRKRKREPFRFCEDDIRIQREGLFPLIAEEWKLPLMAGERYTAKELFSFIPELQSTYHRLFQQKSLAHVFFTRSDSGLQLHIPRQALHPIHLSDTRLVAKLNQAEEGFFSLSTTETNSQAYLSLTYENDAQEIAVMGSGTPLVFAKAPTLFTVEPLWVNLDHPWFYEDKKGDHYLWLGHDRLTPLPEILVHFMLLFSLSMLCRYDPPLWGEIMLENQHAEQILIQQLLELVPRKFPQLMLSAFTGEKLILQVQ